MSKLIQTKKAFTLICFILFGHFLCAQFGPANHINNHIYDPSQMIFVDIDSDGKKDIVSVDNGTISWLKNLDNNSFSDKVEILSRESGINGNIESADLDNDGNPDIIINGTNLNGDNSFFYLRNKGKGLFDPVVQINSSAISDFSSYPVLIEVMDFDGDNDLDIIGAHHDQRSLSGIFWFENRGQTGFGPRTYIDTLAIALQLDAVDFDNDGDLDLKYLEFVSWIQRNFSWFENLGSGSFTSKQVLSTINTYIFSYEYDDIDGDGYEDVYYLNSFSIRWQKNINGTSLGPMVILIDSLNNYGGGYRTMDLDLDGDKDFLLVKNDSINWFENFGNGTVSSIKNFFGDSLNSVFTTSLLLDDIDQDNDIDVFHNAYVSQPNHLSFYKNMGGNFSSAKVINRILPFPVQTTTEDVDLDGDSDVIAWGRGVKCYINNGKGQLAIDTVINQAFINSPEPYFFDIDNDGDQDVGGIVPTTPYWYTLYWHENQGGCNFSAPTFIGFHHTGQFSSSRFEYQGADFDGDGDIDFVMSSTYDTKLILFKNNGANNSWTKSTITNQAGEISYLNAYDLNNDGRSDIIDYNQLDSTLGWRPSNANGSFGSRNTITTDFSNWDRLFFDDVNADGINDIISNRLSTGEVNWYENLGNGSFDSLKHLTPSNQVFRIHRLLDFNQDGEIDFIATPANGGLGLFENKNDSTFEFTQSLMNSFTSSYFMDFADLDQDGDYDLINTGNNHSIAWYENFIGSQYMISGHVYFDKNQNKIKDSSEVGLKDVKLKLTPNDAYSSTEEGHYAFTLGKGQYSLAFDPFDYWSLTTDSLSYNISINDSNKVWSNIDFGFYPDTVISKVNATVSGSFPRCNTIANYWINLDNVGTSELAAQVKLQLADSLSFVSASVSPDSIVGQLCYWNIDTLSFLESRRFKIQVQMPSAAAINDTLKSYLYVNKIDSNLSIIAYDSLIQLVRCSYDPNDKGVSPQGYGNFNYIQKDQELEYLIRFQNTGNDTAINVIITDQLDVNLNWNTVKVIATSHSMQTNIDQKGLIAFSFKEIYLPDSNVNLIESQGFVRFSVELDSNLLPNTSVFNTANIYFDLNPPIVTNTVYNTIECYGTPKPNLTYINRVLQSSVIGNYTYQWFLNGVKISGATQDTLRPVLDGSYHLVVRDSNYCPNASMPYSVIGVYLNENYKSTTSIFPNPFNESTNVVFEDYLEGDFDLVVTNVLGSEILRYNNIKGKHALIQKSEIGKGIFFLHLYNHRNGENEFVGKILSN